MSSQSNLIRLMIGLTRLSLVSGTVSYIVFLKDTRKIGLPQENGFGEEVAVTTSLVLSVPCMLLANAMEGLHSLTSCQNCH